MSNSLTVFYSHRPGAVDRVMSILRRRGFPLQGITLERTHVADVGRMTVTVANPEMIEQVRRHLKKLPDVIEVGEAESDIHREFALLRVRCTSEQQPSVLAALGEVGRPVSISDESVVVEASGDSAAMDAFFDRFAGFEVEDAARTGTIALSSTATIREEIS